MLGFAVFWAFFAVRSVGWHILWVFFVAGLAAAICRQIRIARGRADLLGRVELGGPENLAAALMPWVALAYLTYALRLEAWVTNRPAAGLSEEARAHFAEEPFELRSWVLIAIAIILLLVQLGRRTAVRIARGGLPIEVDRGRRMRRLDPAASPDVTPDVASDVAMESAE